MLVFILKAQMRDKVEMFDKIFVRTLAKMILVSGTFQLMKTSIIVDITKCGSSQKVLVCTPDVVRT